MSAADRVILWEHSYDTYKSTTCGNYGANDLTTNAACGCSTPPCWVSAPAWWTKAQYVGRVVHVVFGSTSCNNRYDVWLKSQSRGSPLLYLWDQDNAVYSDVATCFSSEQTTVLSNLNLNDYNQTITYCGDNCNYTSISGGPNTFSLSSSETVDYYADFNWVAGPGSPSNMTLQMALFLDGNIVATDQVPGGTQAVPFHHQVPNVAAGNHAMQLYFRSVINNNTDHPGIGL